MFSMTKLNERRINFIMNRKTRNKINTGNINLTQVFYYESRHEVNGQSKHSSIKQKRDNALYSTELILLIISFIIVVISTAYLLFNLLKTKNLWSAGTLLYLSLNTIKFLIKHCKH